MKNKKNINIFIDNRISTQPNIDKDYKEKGIIHVCEIIPINIINQCFGERNYKTEYDIGKNRCLIKIQELLNIQQKNNLLNIFKVCNLKIEKTISFSSVFINVYGTLLYK